MHSTTTIHLSEDDYDVTYISPPPAILATNSTPRDDAKQGEWKKYPIWTTDDWQDVHLSPENTILEIVVTPSKSASLNITWTELHAILGDALPATKYLHIVCSKPERLVRLFMLPESEPVALGESCVERGLFGQEVLSSDRKVRESLQGELFLTTSTHTVEEIGQGIYEDVEAWSVGDEDIWESFWPVIKIGTTKALVKVEACKNTWKNIEELYKASKEVRQRDQIAVEEEAEKEKADKEEVEKSGDELTEEALLTFTEEMARLNPAEAYDSKRFDSSCSYALGCD